MALKYYLQRQYRLFLFYRTNDDDDDDAFYTCYIMEKFKSKSDGTQKYHYIVMIIIGIVRKNDIVYHY